MDPERQPLLGVNSDLRSRRHRPLNHEEVLAAHNEIAWRRTRFCLVLMFWAIMAMFLSIIVCLLITSPKCRSYDIDVNLMPSIPPVHMSFAPLVTSKWNGVYDPAYTV